MTKVQKTEEIAFQQTNFHRQNASTQKKSADTCSFEKYVLPLQPLIYIQILFVMYLTAEKKEEIFGKYGKSNTDTGSAESQIALFSYRISSLTEHLKLNAKDYSTERALVMLVGKRRRLLDYLIAKDIERYRHIIKELNIRK